MHVCISKTPGIYEHCTSNLKVNTYHSPRPMRSKVSNVSSLFLLHVPHAPTPPSRSTSSDGIVQFNDSGRLRPTKMNAKSPSPPMSDPNRCHSESKFASILRAITGSNENHRPNADQNGVSLERLRILYDMMIRGCNSKMETEGGEVR
jgi:hypothetical protein